MLKDPKPPEPVSEEIRAETRPVPRCPNCGWHDVRLSYTKNAIDTVLNVISVQRFKCRSCGAYFRRWYRSTV